MPRFNKIVTRADIERALQVLDDEPRLVDASQAPAGSGAVAVRNATSILGSGLGRPVHTDITFVGTTGTAEEVLMSYGLPAGALASDFQGIEIHGAYSTAADANSKTGRLRIGGLGGTELVAATGTHDDLVVVLYAKLWRFTTTTFQGFALALVDGVAPVVSTPIGSATWADAQSIVLTGETPSASGGMDAQQLSVTYIPNP